MLFAVNEPSLFAAFGAGVLSFISPCVLPLVPGYVALMSGFTVADLREGRAPAGRVLAPSLLFVAGFTLVFVALGATAVSLFQSLKEHERVLDQVAGVFVIVMGLFMAGLVSPRLLMAERRFHVSGTEAGVLAAPVMGMAFAFGWTPCIGPILGGVLALAENQQTLGQGVSLLVAYSIGLGVPFVATGLALDRLTGVFEWVKRHYRALNLTSGAVLVVFGVLLLTHRIGWVAGRMIELMDRLGLDFLTQI